MKGFPIQTYYGFMYYDFMYCSFLVPGTLYVEGMLIVAGNF